MPDKKPALWKRIVGYAAFSAFALVTAVMLTFPYEALRNRVRNEADARGFFLRIGSMGPGFLAVRASKVEVSKKAQGDEVPRAVMLDSVSVGPSLFPPGVSATVKLMGGKINVKAGGLGDIHLKVDADDVDLAKGNLKEVFGVDAAGVLGAHVDLKMPKVGSGPNPSEPDLGAASGEAEITASGLGVNGGTVNMVIPQFGPEPAPIDLPKIALGEVKVKLLVEKGQATVDALSAKSDDLEIQGSGSIKLARRLEYSEPNIEIRMKFNPDFQKRLGMVGSALSMIGPDPKDPTWRQGRLTGYLGRPNFR